VHLPALQPGVAPVPLGQAFPHEPQLSASVFVETHSFPQRSSGLQEKSHCPPTQMAVPPAGAVHCAPHPPQLSGSVAVTTHFPPQTV